MGEITKKLCFIKKNAYFLTGKWNSFGGPPRRTSIKLIFCIKCITNLEIVIIFDNNPYLLMREMCKKEVVTVRSNCYRLVRSDRKFDELPFSLHVADFAW